MTDLVRLSKSARVAVITIDNPPVNALSPGVPEGIEAAVRSAQDDPDVDAIVIIGAGRTFVAGADINELAKLGAGGRGPNFHGLLAALEDSPKPVVIAIHGTALGGGLELAMAGHYRVAVGDAQLGLPEVTLGIIPGAEGTQRLPRLVGVAKALDMLITGQMVKAPEAFDIGLVDRIVEGDLLAGALAFASETAAKNGLPLKTSERNEKLGSANSNAAILAAGREQAAKIRRNQTAPLMAIQALEAATTLPFSEGCRQERELSRQTLASDQGRAMIHAFLAERAVSKIPDVPKGTPTYPIRNAAVIGAGTMGGGIAMVLANAGIPVRITDTDQTVLDRGLATIRKNYENSVKRGRFTTEQVNERLALIHPELGYGGIEQADIIIEAVFENMAVKRVVFGELDKIARPDCVLATNTSTLNIDEIARATKRPEMVVGLHFFSPANVMRLVEIVRGAATNKQIIATAMSLAKMLRKVGVLVGNCHGFVGNRMMFPYMREAQFLTEEGATPAQVDAALTGWGMAMGIFAVDDLGGIDVMWRVKQEIKHLEKPGVRKPLVHDKLYEMGRLGQKTGAGWYRYGENRKPIPDAEVEALIEKTASDAGIRRRQISNEEIIERCLFVMINEGARILEEGYALRASDIDTIYLTGYGFPVYRGGPMWYADAVGLAKVYARIQQFQAQYGDLWKPSALLARLAEEGGTFAGFDNDRERSAVAV